MLKIEYKELIYQPLFERLLKGNHLYGSNPFIDRSYYVIPTSDKEIPLLVHSSSEGLLDVKIKSMSPSLHMNPTRELTVPCEGSITTLFLRLDQGYNFITVTNRETLESDDIVLNCRYYATIQYALAQLIYNNISNRIATLKNSIFSLYSTKLVEPLLTGVYKYLPHIKSLQLLSTKILVKTFVSNATTEKAPTQIGSLFTVNTPLDVKNSSVSSTIFDLGRYKLQSYAEKIAGKQIHIWVPSYNVMRWRAFIGYSNNTVGQSIIESTESQVVIKKDSGDVRKHLFNYDRDAYFDITNRYNVDVYGTSEIECETNIYAVSYPLGFQVHDHGEMTNDRSHFDLGIKFDSGLFFDSETLDPTFTYVGLSLDDRNEMARLYDNKLAYDTSLALVYTKGYYIKGVDESRTDVDCYCLANFKGSTCTLIQTVDQDAGYGFYKDYCTWNFDCGIAPNRNVIELDGNNR